MTTHLSPPLLVFLKLDETVMFFYIMGSLRVCVTNIFVLERVFVITTHPFVRHVFPQWLFLLTLSCPIPILAWYVLSNVYRILHLGQEIALSTKGSFVGYVVAVLWSRTQVILAVIYSRFDPTPFICSCFTFTSEKHSMVDMVYSRTISTTRYVFYVSTTHQSIVLTFGGSRHFLITNERFSLIYQRFWFQDLIHGIHNRAKSISPVMLVIQGCYNVHNRTPGLFPAIARPRSGIQTSYFSPLSSFHSLTSCYRTVMLGNVDAVVLACSGVISTTRYDFHLRTTHHSVLLVSSFPQYLPLSQPS